MFGNDTNFYSRVSRSSLYDEVQEQDDYVPMELDIVEVNHESDNNEPDSVDGEEFDFPLFSFGGGSDNSKDTTNQTDQPAGENEGEERGRSTKTMKISLREDSVERIEQERPQSYYFAQYNDDDRQQFAQACITYEELITMSKQLQIDPHPWKVIDLHDYNEKIQVEIISNKRTKRPGKNKRIGKIKAKQRKQEREKIFKQVEKQNKKYLKKKMFHKRGGKKHKKKENNDNKPVYRTE